jgi:hypothetical protein
VATERRPISSVTVLGRATTLTQPDTASAENTRAVVRLVLASPVSRARSQLDAIIKAMRWTSSAMPSSFGRDTSFVRGPVR